MKCPNCKAGLLKSYAENSMPGFEEALSNYCHEILCKRQIVCDECYEKIDNENKIWKLSKLHDKEEHNSVDLS